MTGDCFKEEGTERAVEGDPGNVGGIFTMPVIHKYAELRRKDKSSVWREGGGGGQEGLAKEERKKMG